MSNVMQVEINPDIELDEGRTVGMPDDIKGHLLTNITIYCKKHEIHWTKVDWSVTMRDGQPIIRMKEKT